MKTSDLVQMGLRNLRRRKLRTSLTVVGVVIGTFSIIVMVSLGIGLNENFKSQIMEMGSLTKINVNTYYQNEQGQYQQNDKVTLDEKMARQIMQIPHVVTATPVMNTSGKLVLGKNISYVNLTGLDPSTLSEFDLPKVQKGGQMLDQYHKKDLLVGAGSIYFYNPRGGRVNDQLSKPENLLKNRKIKLTLDSSYGDSMGGVTVEGNSTAPMYDVKIAGVLEESRGEADWNVYMDLNTMLKYKQEYLKSQKITGKQASDQMKPNTIWVKVDNINNVEAVQDAIKEMKLGASSLGDMLKQFQKTSNMIQLVLGGIGAISMLVSAIGIANTMIMSIYERTKEIGVMKVLGCLVGDIRKLFLFEATTIGFIGGVIGVVLSFGASSLINTYGGNVLGNFIGFGMGGGEGAKVSVIPLWLVLLGMLFSIGVGMVSGYYPAKRATKISALEAMKSEG